jgi:hypothetical protein
MRRRRCFNEVGVVPDLRPAFAALYRKSFLPKAITDYYKRPHDLGVQARLLAYARSGWVKKKVARAWLKKHVRPGRLDPASPVQHNVSAGG